MKNKILPMITVLIVVIAICVVVFVPKNKDNKKEISNNKANITKTANLNNSNNTNNNTNKSSTSKSAKKIEAIVNENGNIEIKLEELDKNNATFINYKTPNGYEVELVAVKDENDNIEVAFNTCQVCNGSPRAYFTQKSGKLVCQNCGNIFPLSSVGEPANGCNPMTLEDENVTKNETGITISKDFLIQNEKLFANVKAH